jgi:hypothetical protein
MDSLPAFIKDKLPEEVFNRFMLPRAKNVKPIDDFFEAMQAYVSRTEFGLQMNPVLDRWKPIVEGLPGSGTPITERGYIEKLFDNAIIHRPTWDQRTTKAVFDRINTAIGRELLHVDDVNAAAQLMRNAFMRGVLGPDSAIRHAQQSIFTWAETGRYTGPLFKYIMQGQKENPVAGVVGQFSEVFGHDVRGDARLMRKAIEVDRTFTKWVLSPMGLSENVDRGIAFYAGLEQAIADGKNGTDALKVGFSRASEVFPDLMMSEAHLQAVDFMLRQRPGLLNATRAPMLVARSPLGRLSNIFITPPAHFFQMYQTGIRDGFSQAILNHEPAKLLRYTAMTGALVGLPLAMEQMGGHMESINHHLFFLLFGFPFYRTIMNGVNTIAGKGPIDRERAKDELNDFFKEMLVPGFRYGKKVANIYENIERGYGVDRLGRYMYSSTPYGEMMRAVGVEPKQAYDSRQLSKTLFELSEEYRIEKRAAISKMFEGDASLAGPLMQKWGRPITQDDLARAAKERMMTPSQRGGQGLPSDFRNRFLLQQGQMPRQQQGQPRRLIQ